MFHKTGSCLRCCALLQSLATGEKKEEGRKERVREIMGPVKELDARGMFGQKRGVRGRSREHIKEFLADSGSLGRKEPSWVFPPWCSTRQSPSLQRLERKLSRRVPLQPGSATGPRFERVFFFYLHRWLPFSTFPLFRSRLPRILE